MSRVGSLPIEIQDTISTEIDGLNVTVKGPLGNIAKTFKGEIEILKENGTLLVKPLSSSKESKSMWGTARSIINNMVIGVSKGFVIDLEIIGVGYKVNVTNGYINLALAKSHNTRIFVPNNINASSKGNTLSLSSIDKESLSNFASVIIKERPPEVYKGKGIRRAGQVIKLKETKKK